METVDRGIVMPTAEEVDALQGITNPGEQLVAYYSAGERIGARLGQTWRDIRQAERKGLEIDELWSSAHDLAQLGGMLLTNVNTMHIRSSYCGGWRGRKVHVEAIDAYDPIDTWHKGRSDFEEDEFKFVGSHRDATGRILGWSNVHGPLERTGMKPLRIDQPRRIRADLIHKAQIVAPVTGEPLVRVEFLNESSFTGSKN